MYVPGPCLARHLLVAECGTDRKKNIFDFFLKNRCCMWFLSILYPWIKWLIYFFLEFFNVDAYTVYIHTTYVYIYIYSFSQLKGCSGRNISIPLPLPLLPRRHSVDDFRTMMPGAGRWVAIVPPWLVNHCVGDHGLSQSSGWKHNMMV